MSVHANSRRLEIDCSSSLQNRKQIACNCKHMTSITVQPGQCSASGLGALGWEQKWMVNCKWTGI